MPTKEEREERRRKAIENREVWDEKKRKKFLDDAEEIRPYLEHLTTPTPKPKEKSPLGRLLS